MAKKRIPKAVRDLNMRDGKTGDVRGGGANGISLLLNVCQQKADAANNGALAGAVAGVK